MSTDERDKLFMEQALDQALLASAQGEVPIGCVLVNDLGQIIGTGYNQTIMLSDPTAHAEIIAVRQACLHEANYRLPRAITAYVTLEPCVMCAGALLNARVSRLVVAAKDTRAHSLHKEVDLYSGKYGNHALCVSYGLCSEKAQDILAKFFKERR